MKRMITAWVVAAGLACGLAGTAAAQDRPGLGLGGFYETRIDNNVNDEDLSFDYYGIRLQLRDERWFVAFADLGVSTAEWEDEESDDFTFFGLGCTLWMARAEDLAIPLDLGLFVSMHQGDLDLDVHGVSHDASYSTVVAQGVIRAEGYGLVRPYLRAGIMKSELDDSGLDDEGDWNVTNPAINVGAEIGLTDQLSLALEGNYSEGSGFSVRLDFWF